MERIEKQGRHIFMSSDEIHTWYDQLSKEHDEYLKQYGVSLPASGSVKALWLVFLKKFQGKLVHKDTISAFVQTVIPTAGKDQQVRHLAGSGWYVMNKGDKLPETEEVVPSGYHVLITTENPKPTFLFKALKRAGRISAKNFEQMKQVYGGRCATCGSQEGKPHYLEPSKRTTLQQGHMDPHTALTLENSIPQCQVCNGVYRDDYVFDLKGRIIAVASPRPVMKARRDVKEEIKKALTV